MRCSAAMARVGQVPIDLLGVASNDLRFVPSSIIGRLIEVLIDELDIRGGDCDLEPEEDCCAAGDDQMRGGPVYRLVAPRDVDLPGSEDELCT